MQEQHFHISFLVDQTPHEVFAAIQNVRGWWSEGLEGNSEHLNDEFVYRHKGFHYSKHRLTEVVEDKRIVWLTLDSKLTFVDMQDEWNGTEMIFEISKQNEQTKVDITHRGLVPAFACFENCSKGWTYYLESSLLPLITTGNGNPDKKELATS